MSNAVKQTVTVLDLKHVRFEDLLAWLGFLEEKRHQSKTVLMDAATSVPVVERLLVIHENARSQGADEVMLQRNRDILNTLIALQQMAKGRRRP